jgi:hypothetical protein
MGMLIRDSSNGKVSGIGLGFDPAGALGGLNRIQYSTALENVSGLGLYGELDYWMRVIDDLTARKWYIGRYGDNDYWQLIYSETHANYIIPNQVGFYIIPNAGGSTNFQGVNIGMDVYSFNFEQLS